MENYNSKSDHTVVYEGPLLKRRGVVIYFWSKLYVILRENHKLYLYKENENNIYTDDLPIATVQIDADSEIDDVELVTVTGKNHAFSIVTKKHGSFLFCCDTEDQKQTWLRHLTKEAKKTIVSPISAQPGFIFCSYNVNFALCQLGTYDKEERSIVGAMRSTNADVICIQETTLDWEAYLKIKLKDTYPHMLFYDHKDKSKPLAGGIAVISKFPVDLIELIPSPVEWFPAQLLLLHSPIGDIQILNLHLRPPLTSGALPLPHAYIQSQYDRVAECKVYADKINFDKPLIVCGDFNENESGQSSQYWLKDRALSSALLEHEPTAHTWNWELPLNVYKPKARFDHIFYQKLNCLDANVLHEGVSDHFPILAFFTAKE